MSARSYSSCTWKCNFLAGSSSIETDACLRGLRLDGYIALDALAAEVDEKSKGVGVARPGTEEELLAVDSGRGIDSFLCRDLDFERLCLRTDW